jgi:hypothetical protein
VWRAEGDGEPPLVAEGEGDWSWRAEGDGEQPRRRATTTEGWGYRQARVRGEHRRKLATIESGEGRAVAREGGHEYRGRRGEGRRGDNGF